MGKRRLEDAMKRFPHSDEVELIWRSYQLDPGVRPTGELGLSYHFDTVVVANSFDAHRLAHLARLNGMQEQMQERLFAAYFTEGRDIGDTETLVGLGTDIGLDPSQARAMLAGDRFAEEVRRECQEAQDLGAEGVPFFVIDRRHGFVGAQPSDLILEVLTKAWAEQIGGRAQR